MHHHDIFTLKPMVCEKESRPTTEVTVSHSTDNPDNAIVKVPF